jgi:hypothetical protein
MKKYRPAKLLIFYMQPPAEKERQNYQAKTKRAAPGGAAL